MYTQHTLSLKICLNDVWNQIRYFKFWTPSSLYFWESLYTYKDFVPLDQYSELFLIPHQSLRNTTYLTILELKTEMKVSC